jgi:hypothetical protein
MLRMLKRFWDAFPSIEILEDFAKVDKCTPDKAPASTLIANLWLLTRAGALPWHKEASGDPHFSAYRVGETALEINDIVGEASTDLFGSIITIYETTRPRSSDVEYLLVLKSPCDQVTKHIFENRAHRNEKLREMYEGVDNGFNGCEKLPFPKIDQARRRALQSLNNMFLTN